MDYFGFKELLREAESIRLSVILLKEGIQNHIKEMEYPDDILFTKCDHLELSVRLDNCLHLDDIFYIGDLVQKTEGEMLKIPNFGRKSLNEIKEVLAHMGLGFGMTIPDWETLKPKDN